ncbi:MAG: YbjQ family protein [Chloroflexota bacterium]
MLLTTQNTVEGYEVVETMGVVKGNTIRARNIGRDIIASLRTIVGGEITEYTKLMAEAREQAKDRMIAEAERSGANAIVGVRFTTSTVLQGAAELLAYGTAVKIQPKS